MLDEAVLNDCFMLKYFVGRYKIQEMSDTTIDDFLPVSRYVPDWFVTIKMFEKHDNCFSAIDGIIQSLNVTNAREES